MPQPTQQSVVRQALGLMLHPNRFSCPPGSLWMAENCVISREGIVSKRRGLNRYGNALANAPSSAFEFSQRIVVLDGTTLKYDSDGAGTWASWTGSFSPPSATVPMRAVESNLNVYFTTDTGVYVNDALSGTPRRAGVPAGLDVQVTRVHTGNSWMTYGQVGYRVVWQIEDANTNVKRGAPSFREVVTNPYYDATVDGVSWTRVGATVTIAHASHGHSNGDIIEVLNSSDTAALPNGQYTIGNVAAGAFDVTGIAAGGAAGTCDYYELCYNTLVTTIPSEMAAGDKLEIYRTAVSAGEAVDPSDRHYLVYAYTLVAGDITNGYVSYTDTTDEAFLGLGLYTNDTEEGIALANGRPPYAEYIAVHEGHVWYGNTRREHFKQLQLTDIAGITDDTDYIQVVSGVTTLTYTSSTAEDIPNKKFKRWTTYGTLAQNVEATAKSICHIINRDAANTIIYAYYVSGPDDEPGQIVLRRRTVVDTSFSIIANAAAMGNVWVPQLPTSGTSVSSSADERKHGLYRSKFQQPEAVPELAIDRVGRANKELTGLASLKEALLIFKEDGCWQKSGESDGLGGASFALDELDPTIRLIAPSTLAVLENAAYCLTDQGVMKISPAGGGIVSRQIEVEIQKISKFTNISSIARAIGYESDRKYLLFLQEDSSDTYPKLVWCYDYLTNAWTTWRKNLRGGLVHTVDDKLYCLHAVDSYVLSERKSFETSGTDYRDEDMSITIASTGTATYRGSTVTTITFAWAYPTQPAEGWYVVQGALSAKVVAVTGDGGGNFTCTLNNNGAFAAAAATVSLGFLMKVEWVPDDADAPGVLKRFSIVSVFPEIDGGTHRIGFRSDLKDEFEYIDNVVITRTRGWGSSAWGTSAWGNEPPGRLTCLRSFVPRDHGVCRALSLRFENKYAFEEVHILSTVLDIAAISTRVERL